MHMHKPDWHSAGVHFGHLIHDPRFWAALALVVLLGLMILASIMTKSTGAPITPRSYPSYPYMP